MLLNTDVDIIVYQLDDNGTFDAIGEINQFTSLMWPSKYNGYNTFRLWAPITDENINLIKKGHILWCGGDTAAMIEVVETDTNSDGQKTFDVKGRTLEMLLTTRIIWGTYSCTNKAASTVMYEIVERQCVNPSNVDRKIPFLVCATDKKYGPKITYQKTGGEVYDALEGIGLDNGLGFDVLFRPREKQLVFRVYQGVDRTIGQNVNRPVMFSTELEDLLSSTYYTNDQDYKTIALVAGEGTGENRKRTISGDSGGKGFKRRELYVDARDIQSAVYNEDGSTEVVSPDEYVSMLQNRGDEKLSECTIIETFDAKLRVIGNIQYVYGVDFFCGDKITIEDTELGIKVDAIVSEASENFDDEWELVLTLGYSFPTLIERVKRKFM